MTQRAPDPEGPDDSGPPGPTAWVALACVLLFAALAWPALSGRVYAGNDLDHFHLPLRWFYANALAAGHGFDWMPGLFSGFYLTGEGQAGTWHPLHLLLYGALPLVAAFNLEVLSSYAFLFVGTAALLRHPRTAVPGDPRTGLPWAASLFGAMLFTFSGSTMLHFVHVNAVAVIAHLPWCLLAIEEALRTSSPPPRRGRTLLALAALAALTASMLLCGYPQYVWIVGCAEAAWVVIVLAPPLCLRDIVAATSLLAAKALGLAMAALQVLPTLEHLRGARRYVLSEDLSGTGSLHPLNLVQLLAPYVFTGRTLGDHPHEYGVYAGAVPLLLVTWWLLFRRDAPPSRRDRGVAVLAVVAIGLAFGKYVGSDRVQSMIPFVGVFRFPARFLFLFHFGVAVLAAGAFAELVRRRVDGGGHPGWILAAAAGLFAALLTRALGEPALGPAALVVAGPALFLAAAAALALVLRGRPFALPALVLLAALDAGSYGLSAWAWPASRPLVDILAEVPKPPVDGARIATLQPEALGRYTGNLPVMHGAAMFDGYAGLPQAIQPSPATLEHLRLGAVDYVQRVADDVPVAGLLPGTEEWLRVPDPRPRVRLATRAVVAADAAKALRDSAGTDSPSVVFTSLAVELAGPPGSVLATTREPGRIRVQVQAPARQMLVVAERFHAGWRASVDGTAADVFPVDGGLLGVLVERGAGHVEFVFAPSSLGQGRTIAQGAFVAWSLLVIVGLVLLRGDARDEMRGVES